MPREASGGRVWAESLPGQGSTFVVELPLAKIEPRDADADGDPTRAAGGSRYIRTDPGVGYRFAG